MAEVECHSRHHGSRGVRYHAHTTNCVVGREVYVCVCFRLGNSRIAVDAHEEEGEKEA